MLPFYFGFTNLGSCSYAFLYQLRHRNLILLVKKWCFYFSHQSPEVRALRKQTNHQETHETQYHWQCSIYPCDENWEELFFLLKCTFSSLALEFSPDAKLEAFHLQLLLWFLQVLVRSPLQYLNCLHTLVLPEPRKGETGLLHFYTVL